MKIINIVLIALCLGGLMACSSTLNISQLEYNQELDLYQYPMTPAYDVFLRNEQGHLLDSSNIDQFFEKEIKPKGSKYSIEESIENDKLSSTVDDLQLATTYSKLNKALLNEHYEIALQEADILEKESATMGRYSDVYFLKALTYEALEEPDLASQYYSKFLDNSSGKYSKRFRTYRDTDADNYLFKLERKFAKEQRDSLTLHDYQAFIDVITPTYRHNSYQPGFVLDLENYDRGEKWINMFVVGLYNERIGLSYHINTKIVDQVDFNFSVLSDGDNFGFGVAFPLQLYKTKNKRYGIKVTPFASLINYSEMSIDGHQYALEQSMPNFGIKLSTAYSLNARWSLGAYYKHYVYNENRPFNFRQHDVYCWENNVYDISLYYDVTKAMSLKAGIKNDDVLIGLFWSGWEIAYNVSQMRMVLNVDLY